MQGLEPLIKAALDEDGRITILTGAGISAESGIPTFRGPEGYWSVGSRVYQPQEMATLRMFRKDPRSVWQWYLYRLGICAKANPNAGHLALVEMERSFARRFTLVTQNVDNLHLRAGQSSEKTFEIHGNIFFVRCSKQCHNDIFPLPEAVTGKAKDEEIPDEQWQALHCHKCGGLLRPHILWFDEIYDEPFYRLESTLAVARQTSLLIIIGTSGATNLPNQVVAEVFHHGGVIIDINIETNRFSQIAENYHRGMALRQPGSKALPLILERMTTLKTMV